MITEHEEELNEEIEGLLRILDEESKSGINTTVPELCKLLLKIVKCYHVNEKHQTSRISNTWDAIKSLTRENEYLREVFSRYRMGMNKKLMDVREIRADAAKHYRNANTVAGNNPVTNFIKKEEYVDSEAYEEMQKIEDQKAVKGNLSIFLEIEEYQNDDY